MVNKCTSVCEKKDIAAWAVAAPNILKFVPATRFEVIVPDRQVAEFRERTPSSIEVVCESTYLGGISLEWCEARMPHWAKARAGWYLQQLIKIAALSTGIPGETNLIWDADTVPLKPLSFFNKSGRLEYYKTRDKPDCHPHYFETIKKLTGDDRISNHGFISQSFPARVEWVREYQRTIENLHKLPWFEAIMANIDHTKGGCGYSEYESLGNFFCKNWPSAIEFGDGKYFREGTRLIGRPMDLYNPKWASLSEWIDYIAFEQYQTGSYRGLNVGCGNGPLEKTFQGNYFINSDIDTSPWSDFEFDITKKWPFPDNYFEHIVANNVLEHVDNLIAVCSEADRCLEAGGVLQIEVPFIGSYNHGTDVTHRRGLTFESFNFLLQGSGNYLYRDPGRRVFNYRCISFHREIIQNGSLSREILTQPPVRGSYQDWIELVRRLIIPGTFGFVFQKVE